MMTMRTDFTTPGFVRPPIDDPANLTEVQRFFYEHAGWGYSPDKETPEQGRVRGARRLAEAEAWAKDADLWFDWEVDDDPIEDDIDREEEYDQFRVIVRDADGEVVGSLWSIDLGPGQCMGYDARPHGFERGPFADGLIRKTYDPYVRVIEAELALEVMP